MAVAIFATQNMGLVEVKFINLTSIPVPLGLALVSSAGLGAVAMTLWQSQTSTRKIVSNRPKPSGKSTKQGQQDSFRDSARKSAYDPDYDDADDFDDPIEDDWV